VFEVSVKTISLFKTYLSDFEQKHRYNVLDKYKTIKSGSEIVQHMC